MWSIFHFSSPFLFFPLPLLSSPLLSLLALPVPLSVRTIHIPLWVPLSKAWFQEGRGFFRWTPSRLSPPQPAPLGMELSLPCPCTCTSARTVIYVAIPASPAQPSLQQLGPQPAGPHREGGWASYVAFEHWASFMLCKYTHIVASRNIMSPHIPAWVRGWRICSQLNSHLSIFRFYLSIERNISENC